MKTSSLRRRSRIARGVRLTSLAGVTLGLSFALVGWTSVKSQVEQPMGFSHATHAEEDMACVDCHMRVEEGPYATTPGYKTCLLCHEEAQGEDPDEPRIREYAEREEPIPWIQVNRVVGHVYFSHAPHVVLGEMECADCHGDMSTLDEPVTESQIEWMTMGACMDCHDERNVSNDCLLCHK